MKDYRGRVAAEGHGASGDNFICQKKTRKGSSERKTLPEVFERKGRGHPGKGGKRRIQHYKAHESL